MDKNKAFKWAELELLGVQLIDNTPIEAEEARKEILDIFDKIINKLQQQDSVDICTHCGQPKQLKTIVCKSRGIGHVDG